MTSDAAVFEVSWGTATDRGPHREVNEDSFLALPPVFLVADGMGGHRRGEAASRAVVEAFRDLAHPGWLDPANLHAATATAAERINALSADRHAAPGSTLAGVGITVRDGQPCWLVFNIGDSRTYRLADGELEQISVDHSEVQALIDAGVIAPSAARTHTHRSVITRALGAGLDPDPVLDQWLLIAHEGDRILICSDGLTAELTDQLIAATMLTAHEPATAARELVASAVRAGGRDNVTAVVVDAVRVAARGDAGQVDPMTEDTVVPDLDGDTVPSGHASTGPNQ